MSQTNEKNSAEARPPVRTWRERMGFGADFPLHMPTAVERAMEEEIADLRSQSPRQQMIHAALSHLEIERIAAAIIEVPGTEPQQYIAIGTAAGIGQLLPEMGLVAPAQLADMLAQYRNGERALPSYDELATLVAQPVIPEGEQAGRFDRVTPQADGSFRHSYRGKPVPGPGSAAVPGTSADGTEGGAA